MLKNSPSPLGGNAGGLNSFTSPTSPTRMSAPTSVVPKTSAPPPTPMGIDKAPGGGVVGMGLSAPPPVNMGNPSLGAPKLGGGAAVPMKPVGLQRLGAGGGYAGLQF